MKLYIVGVIALVFLCAGCAGMVTKDDTGEKRLTPHGQEVVAATTVAAKTITGPLGLPSELIDLLVYGGLTVLGIKTGQVVTKKIKDAAPGKMMG